MTQTLAIDGGHPVRTTPVPLWPAPGDLEIADVTAVLRSGRINYWTGDVGRALERTYAEATGRKHAIALASGTLALELALHALGIQPGDEVVVPARTFIATAGSVVACGGAPVVADIDADSGNLTAETVSAVLTPRTRAVIPVHLGGWPVDMDPLVALAAEHDLLVIEDCAQADGARYKGRPVGALGSHAGAFSFCQDKVIPGGEGGMLVLDDDDAYRRAWEYKDQGRSLAKLADTEFMSTPASFRWIADSFGTNWRMNELAAALVSAGHEQLPAWHAARRANALLLAELLADAPGLRIPLPDADVEHAFYRLYAFVEPTALAPGWNRDRVLRSVQAEGVPIQYGSCAEIYREEAFIAAGFAPTGRLEAAARAHETSVAFFVHPTLTSADIHDVATAVRKVLQAATR
jgi:dTDP-4-amino-4,6-dideoxygalactose transaminase